MTLPKDLQNYCRRRIWKRVLPCLILIYVFATILFLWGNVIFNTDNKAFQTSCYIVVMLIPFAVTGVPHKLVDSTYYGRIKKVDIVTSTDVDSSIRPIRESLYFKNNIHLVIERSDGKFIYKKAYSGKARLRNNINTFNEGDSVFHLYGTDTVVILPEANDTIVHCAVCGSANDVKNNKCRDCGHTLIKRI